MCWVRPGFFDANASCFCWVRVLMQVDLPALERPTKAISGTASGGRWCSCAAVGRNLAVGGFCWWGEKGESFGRGGSRIVESPGFAHIQYRTLDMKLLASLLTAAALAASVVAPVAPALAAGDAVKTRPDL